MQSWYSLAAIRRHARALLQDAMKQCDAQYSALPLNAAPAACDAIDTHLAEIEATVWENADAAGRSLACLRSIAAHLRTGESIKDGEREPRLSGAAMLLRQARMAGAVSQDRIDGVADELAELIASGTDFLTATVAELKSLTLTCDVAKANQRLVFLRRAAEANPDLCDLIRPAEQNVARAKLAFATNKAEGRPS